MKPNQINVVRVNIVDGGVRGLTRKKFLPNAQLDVKFMDVEKLSEGAVDTGGPRREFFTLMMKALQENGMFAGPNHDKMIVPNYAGKLVQVHLSITF